MAFSVDGRDSNICLLEKIAADLTGGGWTGTHTSTTFTSKGSWTPTAPAVATDYLLIMCNQFYYDTNSSQGQVRFRIDGTTQHQFNLTPANGAVAEWRTAVLMKQITLPATPTTMTFDLHVKCTVGTETLNGQDGLFILLPWDSFEDQQSFVRIIADGIASLPTTYTDYDGAGSGLSFTPASAGNYLILAAANQTSGDTTTPVWLSLVIDGVRKMESSHVSSTGTASNDQHSYFWASIESFDATAKVIKFQGKRANTTNANNPTIIRQTIYALRIPDKGRLVMADGIVANRQSIATAG